MLKAPEKTHIIIFLLIVTFMQANFALAQIKADKDDVCLGDLVSFSHNTNGLTQYQWTFGDGFSSTMANPKHLYKTSGTFTVQLNAKNAAGSPVIASKTINVRDLPQARLSNTNGSIGCLKTAEFCFQDNSAAASPSQPITSKIIIWGDGAFESSNASQFCHTYQLADKYSVSYEVKDIYGCKSFTDTFVTVVPSVKANLEQTITYPACNTANICLKNTSQSTIGAQVSYELYVDNQLIQQNILTQSYCFDVTSNRDVNIKLYATNKTGCSDSIEYTLPIKFNQNPVLNLDKQKICYGDMQGILANYKRLPGEELKWFINDSLIYENDSQVRILPRNTFQFTKHGTNTLRLETKRGNCTQTLTDTFNINGPVAQIVMFNHIQCNSNEKVFMWAKEQEFLKNLSYKWDLTDPNGENCISERSLDKNKYRNCNESTDWFHKHTYADIKNGYQVRLQVTDTITGCTDNDFNMVNLMVCGNCTPLVDCEQVEVCQNTWFLTPIAGPNDPYKITLDSGKTWLPYPYFISDSLKGIFDLGFIYKFRFPAMARDFGDDSIQIFGPQTVYDTTLCDNNLEVIELIKDSFSVEVLNDCKPLDIKLSFANGQFMPNDTLFVYAADSLYAMVTNSDSFNVDSLIISLDTSGYSGSVTAFFKRKHCETSFSQQVGAGFVFNFFTSGKPCTNEQLCLNFNTIDVATSSIWDNTNALGSISWTLDSVPQPDTSFKLCRNFKDYGEHQVEVFIESALGCKDTFSTTFDIQEIVANVTEESRSFYCNKLRQFFDSSEIKFTSNGDKIDQYLWDWGTGNYTTIEKDPFKSFVGLKDSLKVSHVVISNSGCSDTVTFTVTISSSRPQFSIKDSMGCAPMKVDFLNESVNCTQYIWEFGDSANNTYFTSEKTNPNFTYTKPGRYYVRLIGIDTIFNPYTGSVYYCKSQFPEPGNPQIVTVLPVYETGIINKDTICLGETLTFESESDSGFINDFWIMGDGDQKLSNTGASILHTYDNSGEYEVILSPIAERIQGQPYCHQRDTTKVTVLGVNANFDIDPKSIDPIFYFTNLSTPINAKFNWNFGQPSSGNKNTSEEKDPNHNYGSENGTYTVCLKATNSFGCKDSICKDIESNYKQSIQMYNAFTPNASDFKNSDYDIEIEGESLYDLQIFNRYGVLVYESKVDNDFGSNTNWNGRIFNTGEMCADGTYFYVFKYAFALNPDDIKTVEGVITLIR